jgi:hypothetical protein
LLNGRRSLQRQQFSQYSLMEATTELGQELRQHEVRLGAVDLHLRDAASLPHGQVGAQLATDLFSGTVPFLLE